MRIVPAVGTLSCTQGLLRMTSGSASSVIGATTAVLVVIPMSDFLIKKSGHSELTQNTDIAEKASKQGFRVTAVSLSDNA